MDRDGDGFEAESVGMAEVVLLTALKRLCDFPPTASQPLLADSSGDFSRSKTCFAGKR